MPPRAYQAHEGRRLISGFRAAAEFAVYREDKRMAALVARTWIVINGASSSRVLSNHMRTK